MNKKLVQYSIQFPMALLLGYWCWVVLAPRFLAACLAAWFVGLLWGLLCEHTYRKFFGDE